MDALLQQVGSYLIDQGPMGLLVLIGGYLYFLKDKELRELRLSAAADIEAERARTAEERKLNSDLQEKRLQEALSLRVLVEQTNSKDDALLAALTRGGSS